MCCALPRRYFAGAGHPLLGLGLGLRFGEHLHLDPGSISRLG
ncbi:MULTISPECIES: hypothetical protein [Acidithiobacillus]|nr:MULTISPECIES: hypothetical protein [Acidithiobacillus]